MQGKVPHNSWETEKISELLGFSDLENIIVERGICKSKTMTPMAGFIDFVMAFP